MNYRERLFATYILCGRIGLKEHINMGFIKTIAKKVNLPEKSLIELFNYKFIPHCEHVKAWLKSLEKV